MHTAARKRLHILYIHGRSVGSSSGSGSSFPVQGLLYTVTVTILKNYCGETLLPNGPPRAHDRVPRTGNHREKKCTIVSFPPARSGTTVTKIRAER